MKKSLLILLFAISNFAFAQIKPVAPPENIRFVSFTYPDKVSEKIQVESLPTFLLDKTTMVGTGKKKAKWTFASLTEFEEVRGQAVTKENGKYYYKAKVITHDYAKPYEKFMFDINLVYIDGREGLIFETYDILNAQKIN